jgi:hypothetical protein
MTKQSYTRKTDENLIVVNCLLDEHDLALALDTGASHTTIDLSPLIIAGYEIANAIKTVPIETASGIIDAYVFKIKALTAIGVTKRDIEICAYDFFSYQLITDFDGVLGLDFFEDNKLCIDFKKNILTIQ